MPGSASGHRRAGACWPEPELSVNRVSIVNEINAAPIYSEHMPTRVLERGGGRFVVETDFTAEHLNAVGAVHGGMLSALLDIGLAGGGAVAVNDGEGSYGVTISMTINFVRECGPGRVRCEAEIQGGGVRTKFVDAKLFDDRAGPVATATGTVRVVELPKDPAAARDRS